MKRSNLVCFVWQNYVLDKKCAWTHLVEQQVLSSVEEYSLWFWSQVNFWVAKSTLNIAASAGIRDDEFSKEQELQLEMLRLSGFIS